MKTTFLPSSWQQADTTALEWQIFQQVSVCSLVVTSEGQVTAFKTQTTLDPYMPLTPLRVSNNSTTATAAADVVSDRVRQQLIMSLLR